MHMALRSTVAFLLMGSSAAFAAQTGGFATTDGGNVSGAKSFTARSHSEINSILANARIDPSTGKKVAGCLLYTSRCV